ncbi:tyrosine-type recombinase/integrase [Pseudomonas sp. PP3]|uniref:tyrosine-type recombinase/integrase n=1 Tax=Pseudomonas sp. PP3 TaxID=2815936 RepID=UPI001BB01AC5|nr:tyrosine-type recombinase/integrase [Pseudomonas sp. PP3]
MQVTNQARVKQPEQVEQWEPIPKSIISREGHVIDTSGLSWHLPSTSGRFATCTFDRIKNLKFRYALMRYCMHVIKNISAAYAYNVYTDCWRFLLLVNPEFNDANVVNFEEELVAYVEKMLADTRRDHKLYQVPRVKSWYLWCSQYLSEIGFNDEYACVLEALRIPGGPKGAAVKNEDVDAGPLHRVYELQPLYNALHNTTCNSVSDYQQRAALALFIAHGRNPANLSWLRESDLINVAPGLDEPCWVIKYPRIKKKLLNPRDDFVEAQLPTEFAPYIQQLIAVNRITEPDTWMGVNPEDFDRPLFFNTAVNTAAAKAGQREAFFNYESGYFATLLQGFVLTHRIISPLTNMLLHLSPRRLRYTLATNLVKDGVAQRQLAQILDHTDLQHVQVYFDLAGNIVELLDKALIGPYAQMLGFFRGEFIAPGHSAVNEEDAGKHIPFVYIEDAPDIDLGVCGKHSLCSLHPPYSCYKCPKFQAYINADHEAVLLYLINEREVKFESGNKRIAMQLDEIIFAVGQVVEKCKEVKGVSA